MKWSCLHRWFYDPLFPQTESPVSLEEMKATLSLHPAGEVNTLSKRSKLLPCHSRTAAFSVSVHAETFTKDTGQSCYAAQAQPGKQEKPGLTPCSGSFRESPQQLEISHPKVTISHPASPVPSPSLTTLQGMLHMPIAEESHLQQRSQTRSLEHSKVDSLHAAPS